MKIPKKIKVGGLVYNIKRPSDTFVSNNNASDGEHYYAAQVIRVVNCGSEAYQNVVFLHEVCHAIIRTYCGEFPENEELFVEQFSKGLYQVIVDNGNVFNG